MQHTPMIHFESSLPNATVRGTDIRPALDKYLYEKLGDEIKNEWKINNPSKALNYKISIKCSSNTIHINDQRRDAPMYFGNMGRK
ncbi:MAG: hypothetical protein IPN14_17050 [Bacteroidetes bacterium]|nr:hypothetical protein [Bacteroidota bacterium]